MRRALMRTRPASLRSLSLIVPQVASANSGDGRGVPSGRRAGAQPNKEVRTFRTVTRDLEALRDWLWAAGVTHVGMESTGVYWRPVYAVLEGHFELIVGNARHIRNMPGARPM